MQNKFFLGKRAYLWISKDITNLKTEKIMAYFKDLNVLTQSKNDESVLWEKAIGL